jgi:hypothetical protein
MQYTPKVKPIMPTMPPEPATPPIATDDKSADLTQPNTNMRWREMEEMEKEKYRDFGALVNNQMGIPYYNNPSKMPAYNRFIPLNTLQQQQQQMLANRSMRASGIPEQLSQSITANTAASAQNAIGQVQLQNARGAVENSNQNNQIFANTYNQNKENEAQNLRRYAMENQDAFAKFKKNQETIYDKMESDSMAKAKVYDNYYAQKNLGIQQGDPYLMTDPKKSGLFNRRINIGYESNPNNRYTKDNNNKGILAGGSEDIVVLNGIINSPESTAKEKLDALQLKHSLQNKHKCHTHQHIVIYYTILSNCK